VSDPVTRLSEALAGRYRIERELGAGGMATVYLAEDLKHHRKVAVKVLREDLSASVGAARFLREIEVVAQLQHPHILALFDSGAARVESRASRLELSTLDPRLSTLLYYVMPYVDGQSLRDRLARERELPIGEALRLTIEILDALAHAHAHGVVHRDVKPDNIMLSGRHALVADFGVARAVRDATTRDSLTSMGVALGTPAYMAPEQAAADPNVDQRADIYAVGAVVYEMLAGRPPFIGHSPQQVLAAQVTEIAEPLSRHRPGVPPALEDAIMRCLAKRPADRWQHAEDLLAVLEPLATPSGGHVPTAALPRGGGRRLAGVVALVATAALAVAAFVAVRTRQPDALAVVSTTQVTHEEGLYLDPALSPDGKLLAYAAGPPSTMRIVVQQLAGGRILPLTTDSAVPQRWPRFSPDGERIAFVSPQGIEITPALGGTVRRLVALDRVPFASPAWSPDGRRIAYSDEAGLDVVDVASGQSTLLAKPPQPLVRGSYWFDLQWSPDGRWIAASSGNFEFAFSSLNLGNTLGSRILLIDTENGRLTALPAPEGALEISPVWLPDSRHLLFVSSREGGRDVYEVAVSNEGAFTGAPERLTTGLLAHGISLSADGHTLAYASYLPSSNVWVIPLSDTGAVSVRSAIELTHGTARIEEVTASPDHRSLLVTSNQAGHSNLFTIPMDGGPPVQLTFDTTDIFRPAWSKDGQEIVFFRSAEDRFYTMPAAGGHPVLVTADQANGHADWSADGRALVVSGISDSLHRLALVQRTEAGWQAPRFLPAPYSAFPAWSRDGRWIAYLTRLGAASDSVGLAVITPEGGTPHILVRVGRLTALSPRLARPVWSDDSRSIFYRAIDPDGVISIHAVPVDGGAPRVLVRFDDPDSPPGVRSRFSVADGRLYMSITKHRSTVGTATLERR
jgi:serine/threonine-protein kinase